MFAATNALCGNTDGHALTAVGNDNLADNLVVDAACGTVDDDDDEEEEEEVVVTADDNIG